MKPLRISLLVACCVQLLFSGCTDNALTPDINMFFNINKPKSQYFTFDAGESKTIIGAQKTMIFFPRGSFLTQGGQVITSGKVEVELKEVFTPKDMILSRISTVSDGQLLMSAGQVYINAKQNGQTLLVNRNVSRPRLLMPTTNIAEPMQKFYGGMQTINGNPTLTWTLADSAVAYPSFGPSAGILDSTRRYYNFNFDSLTWINCDYFYRDSNTVTPVSVVVPETFDNTNSAAYLVFPDLNSVIGMAGYNAVTHTFTTNFTVPLVNATIVVVAGKDDQYYYYTHHVAITNNHVETAILTPTSEAAIKDALDEL